MTNKLLAESDYHAILQRRLNHTDFKFLNAEYKPISENTEGFMGDHYKLNITYQHSDNTDGVERFFLKTKTSKNEVQELAVNQLNVYEREIFIYDVLLREFAKSGYDVTFAPECYHFVPGVTLVLQDVTLDQYKLPERAKPYALDQMQALLTSLAKFHGAGFAYERTKTKELARPFILGEEYPDMLREVLFVNYLNQESFSMDWWNTTFKAMDKIIGVLQISDGDKQNLRQLIKDAEFGKCFATETTLARTCGHADLWSNNMMFQRSANGPTKCCLLDFQTGRYFYPAFDVLIAIFFNTTAEFRNDHLSELYQYYYDTLSQTLKNYGYLIADILTIEEFYESIEMIRYEALVQVVSVNIFIYVPAEVLTGHVNSGGEAMQKEMFDKKDEIALDSYKNNNNFRKTITDNLMDIYHTLSARPDLV